MDAIPGEKDAAKIQTFETPPSLTCWPSFRGYGSFYTIQALWEFFIGILQENPVALISAYWRIGWKESSSRRLHSVFNCSALRDNLDCERGIW
jgi:hypothetical protein